MPATLVDTVRTLYNAGNNTQVMELLPTGWERAHTGVDLALLHYYRGSAAWKLEDYLGAGKDYAAAYALIDHVIDDESSCWIALAYGLRQGRMGDAAEAARIIAGAYETYAPNHLQRGYVLWGWGWNACEAGDFDAGLDLLRRAIGTFLVCGSELDILCSTVDIAECYRKAGRSTAAWEELRAIEGRVHIMSERWQALYGNVRAECAEALSEVVQSAYWTLFALETAERAGSHQQLSRARSNHLKIAAQLGMSVEAVAEQAYDAAVNANDGARLQLARTLCGRREPA
jgi:tetratricopeptide (TPR) repeat protein